MHNGPNHPPRVGPKVLANWYILIICLCLWRPKYSLSNDVMLHFMIFVSESLIGIRDDQLKHGFVEQVQAQDFVGIGACCIQQVLGLVDL